MPELDLTRITYERTPLRFEARTDFITGQHVQEDVAYEDLQQRMEEANDSYRVIKDVRGTPHELIVFNQDKADNAVIFKPSTSFSSGYKNPANVLETALAATLNPGAAYVYWGSFGNHPTGHMTRDDRGYLRASGRYTTGNGSDRHPYEAVDSVKFLAEMLDDSEYRPTHIMADQEAGRVALGIMTALGANSIKGAYLNGIDGISKGANYVAAPFIEDMESRVRRRRADGDSKPGDLTPVNIKELKQHMPNVYSGRGRIAHLAPLPVILFPKDVRDKVGLTLGFRQHNNLNDLGDHAVFQDTMAALHQQDTNITVQFNEGSHQHDVMDCRIFAQHVMNQLFEKPALLSDKRGLTVLLGKGNWTEGTDKPHESARTQRVALPDIKHMLMMIAGGRLADTELLGITAEKAA